MFRNYFLVSIILLIVVHFQSFGQWPTTPSVNTSISTANGDQTFPTAVTNGFGGAIIAWSDMRNGTDSDIYVQEISFDGITEWAASGVAIATGSGQQEGPVMIADNSGGAIISWMDNRSGTNKVYVQRVNSSGVVQWTSNGVAISSVAGVQTSPAIVSDGGGGVIVAWTDSRNAGSSNDIYAQRLNGSGVAQWAADGVLVCSASGSQSEPIITSDNQGGAIIAWQDQRTDPSNDIYVQRISSTGVVQWTTNGVAVCTSNNIQSLEEIVVDGSSGAFVSWHDLRNGTNLDLYVQRINSNGVIQWTTNGVGVCTASSPTEFSDMVQDNAGGVFLAWEDRRDGTCCNSDIYAQHINSSGVALWTANGLSICTANSGQANPDIESDGGNGAFITWHDFRGTFDIYAQHVESNGNVLWTSNGTAVSSASNSQFHPIVVQAGVAGGKAIFVWQDLRDGAQYDIYAQGIFCNTAPSMPGSMSGPSTICSSSSNTYSVSDVTDATRYIWTLPSGWTGTSSTTSIDATSNSTSGSITVASANLCGASPALSKTVMVNTVPGTPGSISGGASLCAGVAGAYTVSTVTGATGYLWTLPNGWSGSSTTNSINVTPGTAGGDITVKATNTCGTSAVSAKNVSVILIPTTPGTISGPNNIVVNSSNIYSVTSVAGATSYVWSLPLGWTGTSATTSINATAGVSGGSVSVAATNSCGTSAASTKQITVNKLNQTISFTDPGIVTQGDVPFPLIATSTSGLTVTFTSSQPEVASVSGNIVTIHTAGFTILTASQTGNEYYNAASNVTHTLIVDAAVTGIEAGSIISGMRVYPNPGSGQFEILTLLNVHPSDFSLLDLFGRALSVSVSQLDEQRFSLDLGVQPQGVYFVGVKGYSGFIRLVKR